MKHFKEWFKEKWEYTSFRYGVTIAVLVVMCIAVNIYAYFRDSKEAAINNDTQESVVAVTE